LVRDPFLPDIAFGGLIAQATGESWLRTKVGSEGDATGGCTSPMAPLCSAGRQQASHRPVAQGGSPGQGKFALTIVGR